MEHRERIARMLSDGVLDTGQAERLLASLEGPAKTPGIIRKRSYIPLLLLVFMFAVLLAIAFLVPERGPTTAQDVASTLNQPGSIGAMNRNLTRIGGLLLLLVIPFLIVAFTYNGLVNREEALISAWSDVESNYQRRADLVPRLVESVGRFLRHEAETLDAVTQTRSTALQAAVDELIRRQAESAAALSAIGAAPPDDGAPLAELSARDAGLRRALHGFNAVAEAYPELRSGDQFLALQAQLEGSENRINVARLRFNESVETYNAALRRLPGSLVAVIGGFQRKAYFKADAGSDRAAPLGLE